MLIDKHAWRLFPPPMEEFTVLVAGQEFRTRIVAEDCNCVPPPHQHYHLEAGHFRHLLDFSPGRTILVQRDPAGSYRLDMADAVLPAGRQAELQGVRVGCYAGSRGNEEPRWVEIEGVRRPVRDVESRWREPDRDGWRVTLDDGRRLILYYVPNTHLWSVEQI